MIKRFLLILTLIFSSESCTLSDFNQNNLVKTTSSAGGGYLGYHLSDGDLFSTSIGSTVGLIIGSYLADFLGQDDYYFYKQETLRTLELSDYDNSLLTGYWRNPKSGSKGVVKIKGY